MKTLYKLCVVVLFCAAAFDDSKKEAEKLGGLLGRIEEQITALAGKLERLGKHDAASKLRNALETLKSRGAESVLKDILNKLSHAQPRFEAALDDAKKMDMIFEEVLAILEGREFDRERIERIKKIKELAGDIEKLKGAIDHSMKQIADQYGKDYKEMAGKLDKMIKEQEKLNDQTKESPSGSIGKQMDDARQKVSSLYDRQKQLKDKYDSLIPPELKDLSDKVSEISKLLDKQNELKNKTDYMRYKTANTKAMKDTLDQLAKALEGKDPKSLQDAVKGLEELNLYDTEESRPLAERLFDAYSKLKDPSGNLEDKMAEAANTLKKLADEYGKLNDIYSKEAAEALKKMKEEQDNLASKAGQIADSLKNSEDGKSDAAGRMKQAETDMKKSSQAMQDQDMDGSSSSQESASENMKKAMQSLSKQMKERMSKLDKDALDKIEKEQKNLADETDKLANELDKSDITPPGSEASKAMERAKDSLSKASKSSKSASSNSSKNPSKTSSSQSKSMQQLSKAMESLDPSKLNKEKTDKERFDDLARDQQALKSELERLTKWIEKKKKEENDDIKELLAKAEENSKKASESMKKAGGKMKMFPPNVPDIHMEQSKILDYMRKAKKELEEAANKKTENPDKKKAEELAKEHERLKAITDELVKKVQSYSKASAEGLESASQNIERSKKHLVEGESPLAEIEMLKASDKAKKAQDELEKLLEEDMRQAQEEIITTLLEELKRFREEQGRILAATRLLDDAKRQALEKGESFARANLIEAKKQARLQDDLQQKARALVSLLRESEAEVYAFGLETIADDMGFVSKFLGNLDFSQACQSQQLDIIARTEDLIEDLYRKLRVKPLSDSGKPPPVGKPPLVDDLAQLKFLTRMQDYLMKQTTLLMEKLRRQRERLSEVEKAILEKLLERQSNIQTLLESILKKYDSTDKPGGEEDPEHEGD